MSDVQIPHFSQPFRVVAGAAVVNEQGSPEEIADCVQTILRYPLGSRVELPEFGLPDQTFLQDGADAEQIQAAITTWEPRANSTVDVTVDAGLVSVGEITVAVAPGGTSA